MLLAGWECEYTALESLLSLRSPLPSQETQMGRMDFFMIPESTFDQSSLVAVP